MIKLKDNVGMLAEAILYESVPEGLESLKEDNLNEGVNKRLGWMDELIDQLGSEKKVLEEVFRALSDKEAKEIHAWIMRHWS